MPKDTRELLTPDFAINYLEGNCLFSALHVNLAATNEQKGLPATDQKLYDTTRG